MNNMKRKITFTQCDVPLTLCANIHFVKSIKIVFQFLFLHFRSVQFIIYSMAGSLVATCDLQTVNIPSIYKVH